MPIYIGIDPGKTDGCIGRHGDVSGVERLPPTVTGLANKLRILRDEVGIAFVVIEDLSRGFPRRKIDTPHECPACGNQWTTQRSEAMQSPVSVGKMCESFGQIVGVVAALDLRHQLVPAQAWQKWFHLTGKYPSQSKKKAAHLAVAEGLFPADDNPGLKLFQYNADALLLAVYAKELAKRI